MHQTRFIDSALAIVFLYVTFLVSCSSSPTGSVSGELRTGHPITVTFDGPAVGEITESNPFLDYRLTVTFTHEDSGTSYVIPGFFAADRYAGEIRATEGDRWSVHFTPDKEGTWAYVASFRKGSNVVVDLDPVAGSTVSLNGASGTFLISATDKGSP